MEIIKANETHIPEILEIYAKARKFRKMRRWLGYLSLSLARILHIA